MTSRPDPSSLDSQDIVHSAISRDVLWVSGTLICYDIKREPIIIKLLKIVNKY